jgi:hypothetical protein
MMKTKVSPAETPYITVAYGVWQSHGAENKIQHEVNHV